MIRDRIIKINDMIRKLKDKQLLKDVFNIALPDLQSNGENKYSVNDNGIFFDLKLLSDSTLEKIEELLKQNISTETDSITFSMHCSDENDMIEKNIIIKKK
jgi:hypothetical protein